MHVHVHVRACACVCVCVCLQTHWVFLRGTFTTHIIWGNSGSKWREGNPAAWACAKATGSQPKRAGRRANKGWGVRDGGESKWMFSVCYGKIIPEECRVSESRTEAPASVLCNASATAATQTVTVHGKVQQTATTQSWSSNTSTNVRSFYCVKSGLLNSHRTHGWCGNGPSVPRRDANRELKTN